MSYSTLSPPLQISNGATLPLVGEALKIRLPGELNFDVPESLITRTPISGSTRSRSAYHTAIVKAFMINTDESVAHMEVWVVSAISKPNSDGKRSVDLFNSWPESKQKFFIPLPYQPLAGGVQWTHTATPTLFGAPLQVGGYVNVVPSWLHVVPVRFDLNFSKTFKRFQPAVILSVQEMAQINTYRVAITAPIPPSTRTLENSQNDDGETDNLGRRGGPTWAQVVMQRAGDNLAGKKPIGEGGKQQGTQHTGGFMSEDSDDGSQDDWEYEGSFGDLMGILAPQDKCFMEMYEYFREEKRTYAQDNVLQWLGTVA